MVAKVRKIIKIDEEKCDGCGVCVPACVEGALQIINGKAKLVSETYCDGLGACLGECPQDAITIEERPAVDFDEEAAKHHMHHMQHEEETLPCGCPSATVTQFEKKHDHDYEETLACGCPSSTVQQFAKKHEEEAPACGCASAMVTQFDEKEDKEETLACGCSASTVTKFEEKEDKSVHKHKQQSMLGHWPVQLTLVPYTAPFLKDADVLLVADCVPFAYGDFHRDFARDHVILVACPKLDDFQAHLEKLTGIIQKSNLKSLTVLHMEVPCCSGLVHMAEEAIKLSGKKIPFSEQTIGMRGDLK
ncbi:MAG: 4Fe-4S binding protein [Chloroflexi bacterium]|nr:4Fe-4S binding protein [Chloroflexota bacterium]